METTLSFLPVLRLLLMATFVAQTGLLLAAPIPSPVSSRRVLQGLYRPENGEAGRVPAGHHLELLPGLTALVGAVLTLVVSLRPSFGAGLLPEGIFFYAWMAPAGGVCLLAGNAMIAAAVIALKCNTTFTSNGLNEKLLTHGIFGVVRHPIAVGMGLIYLGFFLAVPSPFVLIGFLGYAIHQYRRLAEEERLLEKAFGPAYRNYRLRVGRFWPRKPHVR